MRIFTFLAAAAAAGACLSALAAGRPAAAKTAGETLLLDDFRGGGVSALGTRWQFFSDRVMGGVSDGRSDVMTWGGRPCIRLRGTVSLENNGGFIQTRLPLAEGRGSLDASGYKGVRFWARGNGEEYAIHLRTAHTWLPWQYYQAKFTAPAKWQLVEVPFSAFKPGSLKRQLDHSRLKSAALVAIYRQMTADVAIADLQLYR